MPEGFSQSLGCFAGQLASVSVVNAKKDTLFDVPLKNIMYTGAAGLNHFAITVRSRYRDLFAFCALVAFTARWLSDYGKQKKKRWLMGTSKEQLHVHAVRLSPVSLCSFLFVIRYGILFCHIFTNPKAGSSTMVPCIIGEAFKPLERNGLTNPVRSVIVKMLFVYMRISAT